ncbi:hypothetical protein AAFM79_04895 [Trichormus azollae HNT15244]
MNFFYPTPAITWPISSGVAPVAKIPRINDSIESEESLFSVELDFLQN